MFIFLYSLPEKKKDFYRACAVKVSLFQTAAGLMAGVTRQPRFPASYSLFRWQLYRIPGRHARGEIAAGALFLCGWGIS